jgi:hypothetical protein
MRIRLWDWIKDTAMKAGIQATLIIFLAGVMVGLFIGSFF